MIKNIAKLALSAFILINTNSLVYSHPGHAGHEEDKQLPYERLIHVQDLNWKIETSDPAAIKVSILDKNFKPISLEKASAKASIKTRKYRKEINLTSEGDYLTGKINLSDEKKYQVVVSLVMEGKKYTGTFIF